MSFCPVYGLYRAFLLPMYFPFADFFGDSRAVLVPVWMLYNFSHIHIFHPVQLWPIGKSCQLEDFTCQNMEVARAGKSWKLEDFANLLLVGISRIFQVNF